MSPSAQRVVRVAALLRTAAGPRPAKATSVPWPVANRFPRCDVPRAHLISEMSTTDARMALPQRLREGAQSGSFRGAQNT